MCLGLCHTIQFNLSWSRNCRNHPTIIVCNALTLVFRYAEVNNSGNINLKSRLRYFLKVETLSYLVIFKKGE